MAKRDYAGAGVRTTVVGSVLASGAVTITIADATGWPEGGVDGKFAVIVSQGTVRAEKMLVTSRSGTSLTVEASGRAYDETPERAHSNGDGIWPVITAVDIREANHHVNATADAHPASAIGFTPAGTIASTNVQGALAELDTEIPARISSAITTYDGTIDPRLDAIEANGWVTRARVATGFTLHARSASAPSSPTRGDTWLDTDTMELWTYYGATTGWMPPWNTEWGQIAYAQVTSSTTSIGTGGTTIVSTGDFTCVANRRYRITGHCRVSSASTLILAFAAIERNDGGVGYDIANEYLSDTNASAMLDPIKITTLAAGTLNLRLRLSTSTGTVTNSASSGQVTFLMVEDIGPGGSAPSV